MVNCYLIIIYFISEAPLWVCLSFTQYPTDSRRKVLQFGVRVHAEIIRIQTNKINYYFFPSIFNNKKFEKKEIHMKYLFIKTYDKKWKNGWISEKDIWSFDFRSITGYGFNGPNNPDPGPSFSNAGPDTDSTQTPEQATLQNSTLRKKSQPLFHSKLWVYSIIWLQYTVAICI